MRIYGFYDYLLLLPGAFFAPVIHESVKAMCSARLGDPTPKKHGFLRANPFAYFEPIGFIFILIFGYGWGRPVPTSPVYYKDRRKGILITYITPSVVNLLVGIITAIVSGLFSLFISPKLLAPEAQTPVWVITAVRSLFDAAYVFAQCNIGIALFNLLPVHPLDGAKVFQLLLKPNWAVAMNQNEKILQVLLVILMGLGAISKILDPLTKLILNAAW